MSLTITYQNWRPIIETQKNLSYIDKDVSGLTNRLESPSTPFLGKCDSWHRPHKGNAASSKMEEGDFSLTYGKALMSKTY